MGRHSRGVDRFNLLFVCTGNICRSPFAEIITRHLLTGRLGGGADAFDVSSAGVQAVVGAPMHERSRRELVPWHLDGAAAESFVARQLDPAVVVAADLVLGVNVRHRSTVIDRVPEALGTCFSLREFARLAAGVEPHALPDEPVARAHALVDLVRTRRGLTPPAPPDADRVPDPVRGNQHAHHVAATLITEAATTIVDAIAPRGVAVRHA